MNNNKYNSGMTLVELLIAMVIGLILLGGVYTAFLGSTKTYSMNEQLSRVQENGRFAIDVLTRDIRMVGYSGCGGDTVTVENFLNGGGYAFDFGSSIRGYDGGATVWNPVLPVDTGSVTSSSPMLGSDIFVVRTLAAGELALTTTMPPTAATFFVPTGTTSIATNDILMVADCTSSTAAIFQVTNYNVSGGAGNVVHNTGAVSVGPGNSAHTFDFGVGAELIKFRTITYFIRSVDAANNPTEPTLYRRVGLDAVEPLIEGVENMQIRYGEDTDGNNEADVYGTANAVTDWSNVVSVRIGLLLSSPQEMLHGEIDNGTYTVNGTNVIAPGDRRLRLVMSTTIGLRNRLR